MKTEVLGHKGLTPLSTIFFADIIPMRMRQTSYRDYLREIKAG